MERGEWENDPEYPRAPLPAHERTWRHPSEQGAVQWTQSEPPLVVGRGLSVATGTVGAVLAVGLLWLMIPHNNRGGVAVGVSTTVRSTSADDLAARSTTAQGIASSPATTLVALTTTTAVFASVSTASDPDTDPETAASASSGPSVASSPPPTTADQGTTISVPRPAMAFSVAPGHFVVTTAAAVGSQSTVSVRLPGGGSATGTVVSVDAASGVAVISLADDVETQPIETSQIDFPTDSAVVMAPEPTPASVWRDDTGTQITYDPTVELSEGALVLDTDGRMIGLCTKSIHGMHVVDASAMVDAVNSAIAAEAPAWIGMMAKPDDVGNLTVTELAADSPAAAAGVQVGDIVRAADGTPVTTGRALRTILQSHKNGETITLSIVHAGATDPVDIAVVVQPNPGSY